MDVSNVNTGYWALRPAPFPSEATIVVTGLGRSGTTMVSRVLSELGVFMGARLTERSNEDADVRQFVKEQNEAQFERLCRMRDAAHAVWGFKSPGFRDHLAGWEKHLRNPRIIFIFRDLLAIALRNQLSMNTDVLEALALATRGYAKALKQIEQCNAPFLLLSYEKCMENPGRAVQRIGEFCGVALTPEIVESVKQTIRNGDARYLGVRGGD